VITKGEDISWLMKNSTNNLLAELI
jgi:hypothetical protein